MRSCLMLFVFSLAFSFASAQGNAFLSHQHFQNFFIENKGQVEDQNGQARNDVKFIFQSRGFKMILKENSWSYELSKVNHIKNLQAKNIFGEARDAAFDCDDALQFQTNRTDVHLLNANLHPTIIAEEEAGDVVNFYAGENLLIGITNVRHFKKIIYQNIYPNIDLEIKIQDESSLQNLPIEYSFIVHPGGKPELIKLVYEGNSDLTLSENSLCIETLFGKVDESSPVYFTEGSAKKINGSFIKSGNIISFSSANFDRNKTFIIDPTITYSTYFGSDSDDFAEVMEFDSDENIIVTGRTSSTINIATAGAYDNTYGGGNYDMFLLKFNASFQLQWATYFGGTKVDYGWVIALDANDNIYLGGEAYSDGLATAGVQQKTIEGAESDGLIAKFKSNGTLVWSRYFGGGAKDQVLGMAIDKEGRLIITGYTLSADSIATTGAYQTTFGGNGDIFLAALDTTIGNAIWSTYYGANKDDRGHHVVIDAGNQIYMSGTALSTTGIATAGTHHPNLAGSFDGFLAKFSAAGIPIWGTYVGGFYEDRGRDIVIDHDGNIYMTGFTQSDTGIATTGTWKESRTAGVDSTGYNTLDAYLIKYDTNGNRLWGTYFGDTLSETSRGIAVNGNNEIFITGATYSAHGITYNDPWQTTLGGVSDAYFAKFNPDGGLIFSSYFGGSDEEQVGGYGLVIRVDSENNFYLCSSTQSADSIATDDAYQTAQAGGFDVFIAKFADTLIADGTGPPRPEVFQSELILSPNPVHDFFFARLNADQKTSAVMEIFSLHGNLIMREDVMLDVGENEFQVSLKHFSSGIYFITLYDGTTLWRKKLVVE